MLETRVSVSTMWTSPEAPCDSPGDSPEDGMLTQLLMGEPLLVLDRAGDWVRGCAPWQGSSLDARGYPGWVRAADLADPVPRTDGPIAVVTARSTLCALEHEQAVELSCGTWLWTDAVEEGAAVVLLPGGRKGRVPVGALRLSDKKAGPSFGAADLLDTARLFLGLEYVWGGTSTWGLDCSGLVHLAYRAQAVLVPRDAADQAAATDPVDPAHAAPGDLYFFARPEAEIHHVGFVTAAAGADGTRQMLHAPQVGARLVEEALGPERLQTLVGAGRLRLAQ